MKKWSEKDGVEYWTMPANRAEEALEVLRNGFFPDETYCLATGVADDTAAQKELEDLAVVSAQDEVSIMAVDTETKKIVGVCYNKYQVAPLPGEKNFFEKFRDTRCKTKAAIGLIDEMLWSDSLVDIYDKYKVDCSLELMFLATHKDYRRRRIAMECLNASLALARTLPSPKCPKRPPIATSIFTSPLSVKIGRSFGFDEIVHVSLQERSFEGKRFCDHPKIGLDHSGVVIMAKRL